MLTYNIDPNSLYIFITTKVKIIYKVSFVLSIISQIV